MPTGVQFNGLKHKPLVLIAPLDWGFGHTTRCIPLISYLLSLNCSVLVACNPAQKGILEPEFPEITFVNLSGYNIKYAATGIGTYLKMVLQVPRIKKAIRIEQQWLKQQINDQKPDFIISDNRYGIYSETIPSVIITHQLLIRTSIGRAADRWLQKMNYRLLSRFRFCWIPDEREMPCYAGVLSHPDILPSNPVRYIGCLTRFNKCFTTEKDFILIIFSGPEPQRTVFEKLVLSQIKGRREQFIIVRAIQSETSIPTSAPNITLIEFANAKELNALICEANLIIARSGYTTIMDILSLQKRSVLIPTPGQTEQIYLAKHMMENKFAWTTPQKNFTLQEALKASADFDYNLPGINTEGYKEAINEFIGLRPEAN